MAIFRQQRPFFSATGRSVALWWLCALLLVLAPSVGQIHRVLHGGHGAHPPLALHHAAHSHADQWATGLHRLFASHNATDTNCLLLDQGSWATPETGLCQLPAAAPAMQCPALWYRHLANTRLVAFQARAPPTVLLG